MNSYEFEFKGLKYKITYTSTVDKGHFYTLWHSASGIDWYAVADSRPPINLSSAATDMYVVLDFARYLQ